MNLEHGWVKELCTLSCAVLGTDLSNLCTPFLKIQGINGCVCIDLGLIRRMICLAICCQESSSDGSSSPALLLQEYVLNLATFRSSQNSENSLKKNPLRGLILLFDIFYLSSFGHVIGTLQSSAVCGEVM